MAENRRCFEHERPDQAETPTSVSWLGRAERASSVPFLPALPSVTELAEVRLLRVGTPLESNDPRAESNGQD